MKRCITTILLIVHILSINSQSVDILKDSCKHTSGKTKADLLLKIGKIYKQTLYDSAIIYFRKAYEVSNKSNYDYGQAESLLYEGMTLYNKSKDTLCIDRVLNATQIYKNINDYRGIIDSYASLAYIYCNYGNINKSMDFADKAIILSESISDSVYIAKAYTSKGDILIKTSNFNEAIKFQFKAINIYNKLKDYTEEARLHISISNTYTLLDEYKHGILYLKKALIYLESIDTTWDLGSAYVQLGGLYKQVNKLDSASLYSRMGQKIMHKFGDEYSIAGININIGNIEKARGNYHTAIKCFNEALIFMQNHKQLYYVAMINTNIGNTLMLQNKFQSAIVKYKNSIAISKQIKSQRSLYNNYNQLSIAYSSIGNYKEAYLYINKSIAIKDSIFTSERYREVQDLETKYQTEIKEKKILLQTSKLNQKTMIINTFIAIAAFIIISSVILFKNYTKKKRLQLELIKKKEQLVNEEYNNLYKEHKIRISESNLEGQEQEKNRIARELHDGICSELSGIKLQLEAGMLNNESAIHKIQKVYSDTRKLSHEMTLPLIADADFDVLIKELAVSMLKKEIKHNVVYSNQSDGYDIPEKVQYNVYRIIQESITNINKHSNANSCNITTLLSSNQLICSIKDNGNGIADNTYGFGINNIKKRVNTLNGKLEIDSNYYGTEIKCVIPLN